MYAFFDKFGKKILAVAAALLIVVFLLPPNFGGGGGGGRHGDRLGTIAGEPVNASAVQIANQRYRSLADLVRSVRDPRQPGAEREMAVPQLLFGPALSKQFADNPLQWYLLINEARSAGVMVDEAEVDELLSDPTRYRKPDGTMVSLSGEFPPALREQLKSDVRDLALVATYFDRGLRSIKVSQPILNDFLARRQQQIQLRVAVIEASQYAGEVLSVSDEDLRQQFDAFASTVPGTVDKNRNPFGFGYRIPNRVRLQYIAVPEAEVERAVIASKSDDLWEEDAIIFHKRNAAQFQTTQPSEQANSASTQPTNNPPTTRPFAEARADVLNAMREPLIKQRQQAVVNRISQQLQADFQKAVTAAGGTATSQPATQQVEAVRTGFGVPYGSFEYLQKLADDVQRQFQVKVAVVNEPNLLSEDQIRELPGLGSTFVADGARQPMSFPRDAARYLLESIRPLQEGESLQRAGLIDVLQPTRPFEGVEAAYVARVVEVEASRPPRVLDEVRAQVEKDVRAKLNFAKAVEAGEKLIAAAKTAGGLQSAPGAGVVQTTKFFDGTPYAEVGLEGAEAWSYKLIDPAFDLLRDLKSPADLPLFSVVKLQTDGKVVLAQLMEVKTQLRSGQESIERMMAEPEVFQSLVRGVQIDQWFSVESVARRVGYVPDAPPSETDAPAPADRPRPINPFAP